MTRITVQEKYSRYWPVVAGGSALLSLILWIVYFYTYEILLQGYLRLAAFGFFALALLSFLKVRDGRIRVDLLSGESGDLEVRYQVPKQEPEQEFFDLSKIQAAEVVSVPNRTLYHDFAEDLTIRLTISGGGSIYFPEIAGRIIPLTRANAEKLADFLQQQISDS